MRCRFPLAVRTTRCSGVNSWKATCEDASCAPMMSPRPGSGGILKLFCVPATSQQEGNADDRIRRSDSVIHHSRGGCVIAGVKIDSETPCNGAPRHPVLPPLAHMGGLHGRKWHACYRYSHYRDNFYSFLMQPSSPRVESVQSQIDCVLSRVPSARLDREGHETRGAPCIARCIASHGS